MLIADTYFINRGHADTKLIFLLLALKTFGYYNLASGLDSIPPMILKERSYEIANILQKIFQISIRTEQVPDDWK